MQYAIEVNELSKVYPRFTLDKITFALPAGCIMGLIGENGAGKTTLIRLLLNMIKKSGGSASVLGKDTQERDFYLKKEEIGVVLDEFKLYESATVKQVDVIMQGVYKNWSTDVFHSYIERLQVPKNKKFHEFSRGMRMKLGLAIALAHAPQLLILDEATSGLDPVAREAVLDILMEFTRDESHSVLISSHIVGDLEKICDYITFFHKGHMLLCEEKDALLDSYGIWQCTQEQLDTLADTAIVAQSKTPYGINALVRRDQLPDRLQVRSVELEELFVFMVKEKTE